jgi:phospholipid/cholesterol/gamma-HCH transport system substrate-binding protein
MSGLTARVSANIITVVVVSVMVVIGAFLTYISGVVFDDSYEVQVPMPDAGGVLPGQEVTLLGQAVGVVDEVEVVDGGVLLTLSINGDQSVPREADVQVLRRSPIGEQAVDFQPLAAGWTSAEPGTLIEPRDATVPAPVPFLLEQTVALFEAMDVDDVSTLVRELALGLEGRGDRLRNLNRDSLELNRTLVSGIPEFERLIDTSGPVLEALREHRHDLASAFGSGADLTETFAEQRPNVEALLDTGERALDQLDVFTRNTQANFGCLMRDVTELNELLLGPSTYDGANQGLYDSKLDELERMLVNNRFFFDLGFHIIAQPDPQTGLGWTRVHMLLEEEEDAARFDERRPTPEVRPGAACVSDDFGLGVNAVRQADPVEPHFTSPGIDYAPLVDEPRRRARPTTDPGDDAAAPRAGGNRHAAPAPSRDGEDTPAADETTALDTERDGGMADTGGRIVDLLAVGIPLLVLGAAILTWRRRMSHE